MHFPWFSLDFWLWSLFVCYVGHVLGHVRAQTSSRCACGLERTSVSSDAQIGTMHAYRVHVCRGCGAVYTRKLYP